jgi:hypothetical protein
VVPVQTNEVISVNSLSLTKTFQLSFLFLENTLLYQKSSNDIVRLPELSAKIRWYVNGNLFKKALRFQLGAAAWFNTSYYGNAWNPAARAFYLQDGCILNRRNQKGHHICEIRTCQYGLDEPGILQYTTLSFANKSLKIRC